MEIRTDSSTRELAAHQQATLCHAPVTIFAIPKAFSGDAVRIQSNAFRSWARLGPSVDVLLFGDEPGIENFANSHRLAHISRIERNHNGTPLVSSAFAAAHAASSSSILVYCNSDVILDSDFVRALERLESQRQIEQWLAIGQRTDLQVDREINFDCSSDIEFLRAHHARQGIKSSAVCKEYFAFNRRLFQQIPPFAVGRGNWDNWMVASTKKLAIPVIDLSSQVTAIHQSHDYSHMNASRLKCYLSGSEARENERLAGGRNWVSGTSCTHRLTDNGIEKITALQAAIDFAKDLPRSARLVRQVLFGR